LPQLKDFSSASAADVDGDGDIDIWVNNGGPGTDGRVESYLMLNDGAGRFTIVAQQGSGVFQPHVGFNGRIPEGLGGAYNTFFADTDNDGDPDLIMGYNGLPINPRVTVLINDGTGRFSLSAPNVLPFPPFGGTGLVSRAVAEDLNLDGYVDFILAVFPTLTATSANGHYFQVLINNGDGTFSDQTAARIPGQSDALRNDVLGPYHFLADLDGDGHKDLLAKFPADFYTGDTFPTQQDWKTEFYKNDGKGFFTRLPEGDYFHIEPIFFPLDVDGDGITDFVNPATFRFSTDEVWASLIKATGPPRTLFAATLPSSRSVQVGQAATFFATVINAGTTEATGCVIDKLSGVKGTISFQATDPISNVPVGLPNTPVTIAAGGSQTFVVSVIPTAQFTSTEFALYFGCTNTTTVRSRKGLNTVLLSASLTPIPDIVALAATSGNDGIVNVAGSTGTGAFAVATVNVGATGTITASADTGGLALPVNISLCETNPANGQCISAIVGSVTTQINANATPTFGIFVQGNGDVPFDPATNRIFVRFKDADGITRGSTSVAVRTQ
jgi:FG-GAP-like repeat